MNKSSVFVRIATSVAGLALVAGVTACGGGDNNNTAPAPAPPAPTPTTQAPQPQPEPTDTQTAQPLPTDTTTTRPSPTDDSSTPSHSCSTTPPLQGDTREELFLDLVRHCTFFDNVSDAAVIATGKNICKAFDQGATFEQVGEALVNQGVPGYEAGWMIGGAVRILCPEHKDKLPSNASGPASLT